MIPRYAAQRWTIILRYAAYRWTMILRYAAQYQNDIKRDQLIKLPCCMT
jgi:hypothetical protein